MSASSVTAESNVAPWLRLERLSPFDAYAQAMGTVMLTIALLQLLCSFYTDTRALRIFALLYLLTGLGWLFAHPRAHGNAADVPLLPAMVAVALIGMNVWGVYEFLGLARKRAPLLLIGTLAVGAALAAWIGTGRATGLTVYAVMAGGFALCAVLAARAARHEGNVGHLYIAAAYLSYPLMVVAYVMLPAQMGGFEVGYYAAVPATVVGLMLLAVSLIRSRRRLQSELRQRRAAEDGLRQLNSTLEERVAARTRELNDLVAGLQSFNRNVSHDLRDPLSALAGLAQLAQLALRHDEPAKAGEHLGLIEDQATQLSGMVHNLLLLSQVSDTPLQRRMHSLTDCAHDALAQLRLLPGPGSLPTQVRVQPLPDGDIDADLMRQVFVNLLGNALKFSAVRGAAATVDVSLVRDARGAAVCVQDNGLGLPDGHEATLFRPFGRLHGDQVAGTGIGLTIARRIVEAHGGRIWAEARDGGGARFLFTLDGLRA